MTAICQRCGESAFDWTVRQSELHVGKIHHWKVQLCERCTEVIEQAVVAAMRQAKP
jgi:ribosomal protein L37E